MDPLLHNRSAIRAAVSILSNNFDEQPRRWIAEHDVIPRIVPRDEEVRDAADRAAFARALPPSARPSCAASALHCRFSGSAARPARRPFARSSSGVRSSCACGVPMTSSNA